MSKILIVSADFNFTTLLEARLLMDDYQVIIAEDGALGFERAQELEPQVIILDAALPKMSGYQLVEKLKTPGGLLRNIPIILVAGQARMQSIFRDTDIFHFCSKPVIPTQFLKKVAEAVKYSKNPPIHTQEFTKEFKQEGITDPPRSQSVLLAGVQQLIVEKMRDFFEEKKFIVEIGRDEDDLVQKAVQMRPDYVFIQFFEEMSVLNAPLIVKRLVRLDGLESLSVFAFCSDNLLRDAMVSMPHATVISFRESQDLLKKVGQALGLMQTFRDEGKPAL